MSSLTPRILRLPVHIDRADIPVDADTGGSIRLWAGSPARLRFAFFFGETLLNSFAGCSGLAVQIKSLSPGGAPPAPDAPWLAERVVTDFNTSVTAEEWEAGTAWHAEVALDGDELNHAAGAYWLVAVALLDEPTTLLAGRFDLLPDGYGSASGAPTPPSPPYTQAEADARFWRRTEVAAAGQDAGADQVPRGNAPALVNGAAAYAALAPVRALVAQGKTRRLLVPGATSAAPLADSGHDLALPGAFAGDEEIVLGGDPRLGVGGGVWMDGLGERPAPLGRMSAMPDVGELQFLVVPEYNGVEQVLFSNWFIDAGYGNIRISFEPAGLVVLNIGAGGPGQHTEVVYPAGTFDWHAGEVFVGMTYSPEDGIRLLINGVEPAGRSVVLNSYTGFSVWTFGVLPALGAENGSIHYPFKGRVIKWVWFNYVLSETERRLWKKGKWTKNTGVPGRALLAASTGDVSTVPGPTNPPASWSYTGGTLTMHFAEGSVYGGLGIYPAGGVIAGRRYRMSGNITDAVSFPLGGYAVPGRQAHPFPNGFLAGGDPNTLNNLGLGSLGRFSYEAIGAASPYIFWGQDYGTVAPGGETWVVEDFKIEVLGRNGCWEPLTCSKFAWKDSSGNGHHLRFGAGVTALDPRPQTVRIPCVLPDSVIPGVGATSGVFEADLTLVAAGDAAGELAAIKAGDAVDLRLKDRLPGGMLLKQGARVVSDGLVAASVINLNGSDEPTGALGAELTHHL